MAISTTTNNQQIVNARIMAELALQFNIGADILSKGNRHVEKYLGAENSSGDTVMVPVVDSGEVFDDLDLTGKDLSVKRDAVPVSVRPITTAAQLDQETITLSMKEPEAMAKRVAKLALTASTRAYHCLVGAALNAKVISTADITGNGAGYNGRSKLYDVLALCEGSKIGGETFGVIHPLAWSKLVAMFQGNYAPNEKQGSDLYKNELGELGGIRWTKGNHLEMITGKELTGTVGFNYSAVFAQSSYDVQAPYAVPSVVPGPLVDLAGINIDSFFQVKKQGALSLPFTLEGVYSTDVFGNSTGELAVFHLVATVSDGTTVSRAELSAPVYFEGPRQNVTSDAYNFETKTIEDLAVHPLLTPNVRYLAPAVVWKRDDFLVAVKGLEKFYGADSLTIPTNYRDKGILPLRGLAWTNPEKATTIFRVDALMGFAPYLRNSINSIYIQAN